jgi:peptidoglycan/xylan/chitin deacetylase (PgdA/CDA1 family)
MNPFYHKTPSFFKWIYPSSLWSVDAKERVIYLTFDDGPTPEVTDYVLDLLSKFDAKATFFCIGCQIKKERELIEKMIRYGHQIGNHTFNHEHGWDVPLKKYLDSVDQTDKSLAKFGLKSTMFRAPYGRMTFHQYRDMLLKGYKIIFWSHISRDYEEGLNVTKAIKDMCKAKEGAILLFHDSKRAFPNLKLMLPKILESFQEQGYSFQSLPVNNAS